jgi:Flp pilus assembly pilin Flp
MLLKSERGQDVLEYAMLTGLIALGILVMVGLFTGALRDFATNIEKCLDFDAGSECIGGI